jgi:head-tail adaptor
MASPIISPRLFDQLTAFYPETCTIQAAINSMDEANQPIQNWSDLAGHAAIPCAISRPRGGERHTTHQIYSVATHTIALAGYYPAITAKMRAVVSGQAYDILLPENDGQETATELVCQVVT